jgi:hypothetical protein
MIEENFLPKGDFFLFTPNMFMFNKIINKIQIFKLKTYDDEFVLKYLVYP